MHPHVGALAHQTLQAFTLRELGALRGSLTTVHEHNHWGKKCSSARQSAGLLIAAIAVVVGVGVAPAQAAGVYESWRFRDGQICFQDHGSTRYDGTAATAKWNAADVNIVSRDVCTGFSRGMIIDLKTYNDPSDYACAKTGSNSYSWEYVRSTGAKVAKWVPNLMVIWINTAASLAPRCNATSGMRAHLLSHELGHALGLAHLPAGTASVMPQGSWSVWWPTALDVRNVNAVY